MNPELMTDHQKRIAEFMRLAGQDLPDSVTVPSVEVRKLRAKLIFEECMETIDALGIGVSVLTSKGWLLLRASSEFAFGANLDPDLRMIADGCADISVVTSGTLLACGIADKPLLEEVDRSNLAKFELPKCPNHPDSTMEHLADKHGINNLGAYRCSHRIVATRQSTAGVIIADVGSRCDYHAMGPHRRPDGKWIKGPDWKEPDIALAISQYPEQQYLHHQPPAKPMREVVEQLYIGAPPDLTMPRDTKTAHCHHCRGILSNKLVKDMKEHLTRAFHCPDCMGVLNLQEIIYA